MALRVLLADESSTIKKVFQLALQDYAVEVTAVNVGIDVEQVAQKTKPDIVFADVLLQKKNGYDLCRDLKANPQLSNIPVVLIWSGFMELDKAKYQACGADANLEKPFDAARLRQLVQNLVSKTKTQPLSQFLTFPKLPDFEELTSPAPAPTPETPVAQAPVMPLTQPTSPLKPGPSISTGSWSMESFEQIEHDHMPPIPEEPLEEFITVDLPTEPPRPPTISRSLPSLSDDSADEAQWVQKTLTRYQLDPEKSVDEPPSIKFKVPEEKIDADSVITKAWQGPSSDSDDDVFELDLSDMTDSEVSKISEKFEMTKEKTAAAVTATAAKTMGLPLQLDEVQLEAIVRAQSAEVIEKMVWQIVPEIATRIIERELERLLKERSER